MAEFSPCSLPLCCLLTSLTHYQLHGIKS